MESKGSNQGILDAVSHIDINDNNIYYIVFDYVVDNQDIRNKYRLLRTYAAKSDNHIVILDMICFEHLILSFDKLVEWTGTGKKDKVKMRMEILKTIENHHFNLSKIQDEKTLKYLAGFKRFSTERVMKSLAGELTENERWSIRGKEMGECCISEHKDRIRCGKPNVKSGSMKMCMLIQSAEVQKVLRDIVV